MAKKKRSAAEVAKSLSEATVNKMLAGAEKFEARAGAGTNYWKKVKSLQKGKRAKK